jgi:hypothetical protein
MSDSPSQWVAHRWSQLGGGGYENVFILVARESNMVKGKLRYWRNSAHDAYNLQVVPWVSLIQLICLKTHELKGMSKFLEIFTWGMDALVKRKDP